MSEPTELLLSDVMAQGPVPAQEAQHYAAGLAEALRRIHDQGTVVGALQPSRIVLAASEVRILPADASATTPYSAPEQLQGEPADIRSDVFSFGSIVYEIFSGRKAFEGDTPEELLQSILQGEPAPLPAEYAEFGHLILKCLAKAPLQRWQRMQRVQMELKLVTVFARRTEQESALKAERIQKLVQAAVAELESRLVARLAAQEEKLSAAARIEQSLRSEIAALEARLESRLEVCESRTAGAENQAADQQTRLAGVDQAIKAHSSSIESLQSAVAQTDDLVERVVEAFDSLERSLTEENELKLAVASN
jgi:eukaryotic-like serine/threonine-protein kinase